MSTASTDYRFAIASPRHDGGAGSALRWTLRRNCSLAPSQLVRFYVGLCIVSLAIASGFWLMGATLIMPFAWLEIAVLGLALMIYARHARDGEIIILEGPVLVVERDHGGATERTVFSRVWVRIEPSGGDGSLIEVSGQGRRVVVGRHLRPELRPALAREIRMALRAA